MAMTVSRGSELYNLRSRVVCFKPETDLKLFQRKRSSLLEGRGSFIQGDNDQASKVLKPQHKKTKHGATQAEDKVPLPDEKDRAEKQQFHSAEYNELSQELADVALDYFNEHRDKEVAEYVLVKPLEYDVRYCSYGLFFHTNFAAKRRDDPEAEVELFFAELTPDDPNFKVEMCRCLGTSTSESVVEGPEVCIICHEAILHPKDYDGIFARRDGVDEVERICEEYENEC